MTVTATAKRRVRQAVLGDTTLTDETAKALIDAINRLIETLGRPQSVVHRHYTQPPITVSSPTYNPHSPYTSPYWVTSGSTGSV